MPKPMKIVPMAVLASFRGRVGEGVILLLLVVLLWLLVFVVSWWWGT